MVNVNILKVSGKKQTIELKMSCVCQTDCCQSQCVNPQIWTTDFCKPIVFSTFSSQNLFYNKNVFKVGVLLQPGLPGGWCLWPCLRVPGTWPGLSDDRMVKMSFRLDPIKLKKLYIFFSPPKCGAQQQDHEVLIFNTRQEPQLPCCLTNCGLWSEFGSE